MGPLGDAELWGKLDGLPGSLSAFQVRNQARGERRQRPPRGAHLNLHRDPAASQAPGEKVKGMQGCSVESLVFSELGDLLADILLPN